MTEVRAEFAWLRAGSQTVQQQALRDFAQAMRNFFAGTHRRPTWRKAGVHEGFRQVGVTPGHVQRLNRRCGRVWVPKVGWVRFGWSRRVPDGVKSYRVTRDRAGRWHIAFAAVPASIPAPGNGRTVGVDRGVVVSTDLARRCDLIRVEDLSVKNMTRSAKGTLAEPGRSVRQKAGLNRAILANAWGLLVCRLEHKAPGRVEKVNAAYTSRTCSACGHVASDSRENQATFRCVACGFRCNADVNAARNIAAGRAVTARGALQPSGGAMNREPQLDTSLHR